MLNFLLHRHQISLMREAAAAGPEARAAHRGLAAGYARRIGDLQTMLGGGFALAAAGRPAARAVFNTDPSENPDRGSGN